MPGAARRPAGSGQRGPRHAAGPAQVRGGVLSVGPGLRGVGHEARQLLDPCRQAQLLPARASTRPGAQTHVRVLHRLAGATPRCGAWPARTTTRACAAWRWRATCSPLAPAAASSSSGTCAPGPSCPRVRVGERGRAAAPCRARLLAGPRLAGMAAASYDRGSERLHRPHPTNLSSRHASHVTSQLHSATLNNTVPPCSSPEPQRPPPTTTVRRACTARRRRSRRRRWRGGSTCSWGRGTWSRTSWCVERWVGGGWRAPGCWAPPAGRCCTVLAGAAAATALGPAHSFYCPLSPPAVLRSLCWDGHQAREQSGAAGAAATRISSMPSNAGVAPACARDRKSHPRCLPLPPPPPQACYAHVWDASHTRLFVCGGPLAFGLKGCYLAAWR